MQEVRLDSTCEIEKEHMLARINGRVRTPKHTRDTTAEHVHQAHRIHVCDWRRSFDHDGMLAPRIAAMIDPEHDLSVVHIDDIRQTIPVHITNEDAPGIVAV